ncbi:TIGR03943 family putative permease subunit [Kribbella jiaozuonensis]|uniref:TIGR03943 family protein n=1 Tax=Kribbella jiaozuonensis TaxID=2575441 RepID=A0A4U3M1J2_9ACTN|nr:TIGR03943 family protein [Kribbella jiaozuonensis]TKK82451.1 TIGR03943 family protein [Kribbella jiaozuonensis]
MKRSIAGLVMVFVGAAVMQLATSGTYLRYVKPGMRWMLLAAGLILIALAVTDVLIKSREDHEHGLPRTAWLLLVPIFALLVVDPPALGADAAQRQSPVAAKPAESQGTSWLGGNTSEPTNLAVRDYAVWAVWEQSSMKGHSFKLTGFVTPAKNGVWYVTRIGLTCCVADGTAYMVEVRGQAAPPKNQWVTITGQWAEPTRRVDGDVAALTVETITPTTAPVNPYE